MNMPSSRETEKSAVRRRLLRGRWSVQTPDLTATTPAAQGVRMTTDQQIASVKYRLSKAEGDRTAWQATGRQEKYLEAYFLVESLECELDRLVKQALAETPPSPARPG